MELKDQLAASRMQCAHLHVTLIQARDALPKDATELRKVVGIALDQCEADQFKLLEDVRMLANQHLQDGDMLGIAANRVYAALGEWRDAL